MCISKRFRGPLKVLHSVNKYGVPCMPFSEASVNNIPLVKHRAPSYVQRNAMKYIHWLATITGQSHKHTLIPLTIHQLANMCTNVYILRSNGVLHIQNAY